jgi:hypothetical protein
MLIFSFTLSTQSEGGGSHNDGVGRRWTKEEDQRLRDAIKAIGPANWKTIAMEYLGGARSDVQCLHRWQKVLQPGLVKGPWTDEEDAVIVECIGKGVTKWSEIAERIPGRLGKQVRWCVLIWVVWAGDGASPGIWTLLALLSIQHGWMDLHPTYTHTQCRDRWVNHLDPGVKKGDWTEEEDAILVEAQAKFGNAWTKSAWLAWSLSFVRSQGGTGRHPQTLTPPTPPTHPPSHPPVARLLPGRSENTVKNRWNSASRRRAKAAKRATAALAMASMPSSSLSLSSSLEGNVQQQAEPGEGKVRASWGC